MNAAFVKSISDIARRARFGALGDDGEWLATAIEMFLAGAAPIDHAMNLAWASACRARRDDALRVFVRLCLPAGASAWAASCRLQSEIRRYETSSWRRDRELANMPPGYRGTSREQLYLALRANADAGERGMPISPRQLVRILRHTPPLVMSNAPAECREEPETERHEGENAGAFVEWRR